MPYNHSEAQGHTSGWAAAGSGPKSRCSFMVCATRAPLMSASGQPAPLNFSTAESSWGRQSCAAALACQAQPHDESHVAKPFWNKCWRGHQPCTCPLRSSHLAALSPSTCGSAEGSAIGRTLRGSFQSLQLVQHPSQLRTIGQVGMQKVAGACIHFLAAPGQAMHTCR